MMRRLLVPVRELDQRRLAPRQTEDRHPRRERTTARVAHGNADRRKARGGREELAVIAARRIEIADQSRDVAPGGIDQRIEPLLLHLPLDGGTERRAECLTRAAS